MSITKLASEVPAPQVPGAPIWIAENAISTGSYTIPNSKPIPQGTTSALPALLCENAVRIDLGARHGAGAFGIAYGLEVTAGTGLIANVSAGQAMMDGVVEMVSAGEVVVSLTVPTYLWLKRDGTLEARYDLTPPAQPAVYLARVETDGTDIESIDLSGVIVLRSGVPERETADLAEPLDTPPSTWRGWTRTRSGLWWWDGAGYKRLVDEVPFTKDRIGGSAVIPADHQQIWFDRLTIAGSLQVAGKVRVVA